MISADLKALASHFRDWGAGGGVQLSREACINIQAALTSLANQADHIETVQIVPRAAYAALVCKEPPWAKHLKSAPVEVLHPCDNRPPADCAALDDPPAGVAEQFTAIAEQLVSEEGL